MTSQANVNRTGWRRAVTGAVAGGALAVGLLVGGAAPTAFAVPTTGADEPPAPKMSTDEALAIVVADYDTGEGGGQLAQLIHDVQVLRSQGYRPSSANGKAIAEALDKRPNQKPLVEALQRTVANQRKQQARSNAQIPQQGGFDPGVGQFPEGIAPFPGGAGAQPGPSGGIQIPLG